MRRQVLGVGAGALMAGLILGTWLTRHPASPQFTRPASPYGLTASQESRIAHYFWDAAHHHNFEVSAAQLHQWIVAGKPVMLLDVRQPRGSQGFDAGHIAGAHNIPLQWMGAELRATRAATLAEPFSSPTRGAYRAPVSVFPLPRHIPIVVMCYDGNGGEMAPVLLRLLGFRAYGLKDGVSLWNTALNVWPNRAAAPAVAAWPVVRGAGPSARGHTAGPYQLGASGTQAVAPFFARANHRYPVGEAFPWTIDPAALAAELSAPHPPQVIDVRSHAAYLRGHIPGSRNIPFPALGANLWQINPAKPVVLVSGMLQRAAQANAILRLMGYHSYVLKQGLADWNVTAVRIPHPQHYPIMGRLQK